MSKLILWKPIFLLCLFCAVAAIDSPAQTFNTLVSFDRTEGEDPSAPVVQGTNGNFYGTPYFGGAKGDGTVFKMTGGAN